MRFTFARRIEGLFTRLLCIAVMFVAFIAVGVVMASAQVSVAVAPHGFDFGSVINQIFGLPGLIGGLGLSVVGLYKLYGDLRKAIKEIGDLVKELTAHVTDPSVKSEAAQALLAIADVMSDLPMLPLKKHAQSLRTAADGLLLGQSSSR
jgi:hypothetical protein